MNTKKFTTILLTTILLAEVTPVTCKASEIEPFTLSENSIIYEKDVKKENRKKENKKNKKKEKEVIKKVSKKKTNSKGRKEVESPHDIYELTDILYNQKTPHKIYSNGRFNNASKLDITQHLMVEPRLGAKQFKREFLRLDTYRPVDKNSLEEYLSNKGVFKGHAEDFINAAKTENIDPIYLVSHAMLESANGKSNLAKGTEINGTLYYNFFGINAFDANPTYGGLSLAQKEDWSSVSKAIHGGAKWISGNYIHAEKFHQKTLYEMRFNPLSDNPWHLYATDLSWADKISTIMNEAAHCYLKDNTYIYEEVIYQ